MKPRDAPPVLSTATLDWWDTSPAWMRRSGSRRMHGVARHGTAHAEVRYAATTGAVWIEQAHGCDLREVTEAADWLAKQGAAIFRAARQSKGELREIDKR